MYSIQCTAKTKKHQSKVNRYIRLDLQYQELNNLQDTAQSDRELRGIERKMDTVWDKHQEVQAMLPKREVTNADRAMREVRGY